MTAHRRNPDPARRNRAPDLIAHAPKGEFKVLRRVSYFAGGPEHVVCRENEGVAVFWDEGMAREYSKWKNQTQAPTGS